LALVSDKKPIQILKENGNLVLIQDSKDNLKVKSWPNIISTVFVNEV
jgi:hypothetical protein